MVLSCCGVVESEARAWTAVRGEFVYSEIGFLDSPMDFKMDFELGFGYLSIFLLPFVLRSSSGWLWLSLWCGTMRSHGLHACCWLAAEGAKEPGELVESIGRLL